MIFALKFPRPWLVALAIGVCFAVGHVSAQPPGPWGSTDADRGPGGQGPMASGKTGLSVNEPGACQGYSLVAPMTSRTTYLIDMEGRVVHTWESDYTPALSAYLLENGHLLRTGAERGRAAMGGAGSGGRIQEFSWDGELVWDFSLSTDRIHPHHDICPMPSGNVLVIAWDRKTEDEAVAAGRVPGSVRGQFLPDCILEVQPTGKTSGKIVWEWHAWDHLIQEVDKDKPNYGEVAEHPERIDVNFGTNVMANMINDPEQLAKLRALGYVGGGDTGGPNADRRGSGGDRGRGNDRDRDSDRGPGGDRGGRGPQGGGPQGGGHMEIDWMHTNSVAYHPELDQIMISLHEFSEVWIIDHSTTTAEAASSQGGRYGKGGDLLYRWGNPRAYRNGTDADQRLFAQHCATWIPEGLPGAGHMLVFNNGMGRRDGQYSTVDEVVLPMDEDGGYVREKYLPFGPERAIWSYQDKGNFFSMNISGAQRLPNGNTFICSGAAGVLFEVTSDKDTVWKFALASGGPGGPGGPMGPGGGPGGPGGIEVGELIPSVLQAMLELTDEQKAKLEELQQEVGEELEKLLTEEQQKQIENPMAFGPGGPPSGPDSDNQRSNRRDRSRRGRGGPQGFTPPRPGEVIPSMIVESLDLTRAQSLQLAKLQKRVDSEVSKLLTRVQKKKLNDLEKSMAGGPGGFGGPGGRGGPGGFGGPGFGGPGGGGPGFGGPGFGGPGFGPGSGTQRDQDDRSDSQARSDDNDDRRGPGRGPGGPGGGGPGGGPGGPGGGGGGIFTCYRYAPDYPGLAGKSLEPGEKLEDLLSGGNDRPLQDRPSR